MATVKGIWVFNDVLATFNTTIYQDVQYTFPTSNYTWTALERLIDGLKIIRTGGSAYAYADVRKSWDIQGAKTINFGTTEQTVSDTFYNWLTANATQQASEETPITLNSIKAKLQGLIDISNEKTGRTDTDLTASVNALAEGYGQGGEYVPEYDGSVKVIGGVIKFTIGGTTYQATGGMTWGEWVESDYNTGYFSYCNYYGVYKGADNNGTDIVELTDGTKMKDTDLIIGGYAYLLTNYLTGGTN